MAYSLKENDFFVKEEIQGYAPMHFRFPRKQYHRQLIFLNNININKTNRNEPLRIKNSNK